MKKLLLSLSCYFLAIAINAQTPSLTWVKQFTGGSTVLPYESKIDAAGNVYTAGAYFGAVDFDPGPSVYTLSPSVSRFVTKLDNNGNFVWAKSFFLDNIFDIVLDASSNVYIVGEFSGTRDFDPGPGTYTATALAAGVASVDAFICKLDANGNFIWVKNIGVGDENEVAKKIAIDLVGNLYINGHITGYTGTSMPIDLDPGITTFTVTNNSSFISKLDGNGNFVWAKGINNLSQSDIQSLDVDATGNLLLAGTFTGTINFDTNGGTSNLTSLGQDDMFIAKLDGNGNLTWVKQTGSTGFDSPNSSTFDSFGNIYTTGIYEGTVDFDPNGGIVNSTSLGSSDIFISKLDGAGNYLWSKSVGGSLADGGVSATTDALGNVYVTGFYNGVADFDPSVGITNLISTGGYDIFITKFDAIGNLQWVNSMGGTSTDYPYTIALDVLNNIHTTGTFKLTCDFDPNAGVANLTATGTDAYIHKMGPTGGTVKVAEISFSSNISVYPNPTKGDLNIDLSNFTESVTAITITDALGQVVLLENTSIQHLTLNTQHLKAGMYFMSVRDSKGNSATQKIIKE